MLSSPSQTCLDLAFDFADMGQYKEAVRLLETLVEQRPEEAYQPVLYALGYFTGLSGENTERKQAYMQAAAKAPLGRTFPFRYAEAAILREAAGRRKCRSIQKYGSGMLRSFGA